MSTLKLALVQMRVTQNKTDNIKTAVSFIEKAKQQGADIVILPEFFVTPYRAHDLGDDTESIPSGEACSVLSNASKKNDIYIVGGTMPERDGDKLFNTCTVWNPQGEFVAKFRKIHLFDIDIKGKITHRESSAFSPGNQLTTFEVKGWKIGLGVCHDLRFEEIAKLYRRKGCHLLVYPSVFNTITGPLHWSLLGRSRANDNQLFVTCVSPARAIEQNNKFTVYGHTQLINPWGEVLAELDTSEGMIIKDIDKKVIEEIRAQFPVFNQRRTEIYDTIECKTPSNGEQHLIVNPSVCKKK